MRISVSATSSCNHEHDLWSCAIIDSADVNQWMKELDGWDIPDIAPTVDGSCAGDPVAAAEAAKRGWWTCGSHTRETDVVACPNKMDWGVRYAGTIT